MKKGLTLGILLLLLCLLPSAVWALGTSDPKGAGGWTLEEGRLTADSDAALADWSARSTPKEKAALKEVILKEGTAIPEDAFLNAVQLKRVELPATLLQIGSRAFQGCESLESLELPAGLRQIDTRAFYGCSGLKEVFFGGRIQVIGSQSFARCTALEEVGLSGEENTGLRILEGAFRQCNALKRAELTGGLTFIGPQAFAGCGNLEEVGLGKELKAIGEEAFLNCISLEEIQLPQSLSSLEPGAFRGCTALRRFCLAADNRRFSAVDGVLFNRDQTALEAYPGGRGRVYQGPEGLRTILPQAFAGSSSLEEVILPSSLTTVAKEAFAGCGSLKRVTFLAGKAPFLAQDVFADCPESLKLFVPETGEGYDKGLWKQPGFPVLSREADSEETLPALTDTAEDGSQEAGYREKEGETKEPGEPWPEEEWKNPFQDVEATAWYYEPVNEAAQKGLLTGVEKERFAPEAGLSRAMLLAVLHRQSQAEPEAYGVKAIKEISFADVPVGRWYSEPIDWAADAGILDSFLGGRFRPDAVITRQEMMTILYNYALAIARSGKEEAAFSLKGIEEATGLGRQKLKEFKDAYRVPSWAETPLAWALGQGLIVGTAQGAGELLLDPSGIVSRAQTAAVLMRLLKEG